jgi:uracil-DNA glycosylase family 4
MDFFSILKSSQSNADIKDEEKALRELCAKGFIEKVGEFMSSDYETRLDYEFQVLKDKKALRYFLLVWDLVKWCRENDILTGSRGSVGCSLIAYLTGITEIDPIKYHLPFSRFLNEERIDLPDIDLDFADNKRHLVTARLHELYGANNIAGISTFNRMKARGAVRDVARVFDVDLKEVDRFTKLIATSIDDALEFNEGKQFAKKYPDIIRIAKQLEGQAKSLGRHAAGKIISSEDLTLGTRAYLSLREDELTVNWEGEDCEHQGLIKLDVLGLNTLTVIAETIRLIKKNHDKVVNFFKIPLNDSVIYQDLSNGRFGGVFQMGYSVRDLIEKMQVDNILEWSDAIALARPGPMDSGMTADYVKRKHGTKWKKKHKLYEEVLKNTYGLVTYQEDIMNVIHKVAGLPYATADRIRKVIGKKRDVKEFEPFKQSFIKGCLQQETLDQDEAEEFWEGLLKHAHYSFNHCLTGDTVVWRSGKGRYCTDPKITLREIYQSWNSDTDVGHKYRWAGLNILQLDIDGRIRPGKMSNIFYQGIQNVYKITTKLGRQIKATINHKFLTDKGYLTINNIQELHNKNIEVSIVSMNPSRQKIRKGRSVRGIGTTYQGFGFRKGEENISWIDGKSVYYKILLRQIKESNITKCEFCQKENLTEKHDIEIAHIRTIDFFNGDYSKYHSRNNIHILCNSCHKKFDYENGTRKKRWSKGLSTQLDSVVSIEYVGEEDTYDVEMNTEQHNFVANELISHNSHALSYAILGYKTLWLLHYFPLEFICASLSYGTEKIKEDMLNEARKINVKIVAPKYTISQAREWTVKNNKLYAPYIAIKGIGDKLADEICTNNAVKKKKGFFASSEVCDMKPKVKSILDTINAFDLKSDELPEGAEVYFDIDLNQYCSHDAITIEERDEFQLNVDLDSCRSCELHKECTKPVHPSPTSLSNVMILGEAPGCISGDSLVDTAFRDKSIYPNGIPIKDLVDKHNIYVYSFDIDNQKIVINKVKNVWCSGVKPVFKVTYEWWFNKPNGDTIKKKASIKVTRNHLFLLKKYKPYDHFSYRNKYNKTYESIQTGMIVGNGLQPFYRRVEDGYSMIGHVSNCFREARFLLEYKIGRKLNNDEQCHHKDQNKLNDDFDNLELHTIQSHSSIHSKGDNNCMKNELVKLKHLTVMRSDAYRKKMSDIMKKVLKDPKIYSERLDQINISKHKIKNTLKEKYKDPDFYYKYLKSRRYSNGRVFTEEEIRKRMKDKFDSSFCDNHVITNIEYAGEEKVYDLEVEGNHSNFVANHIVIHNSTEDEAGRGFVGRAGKVLWEELVKHRLYRKQFHVTNSVKCFPRISKTPTEKQVDACKKWLEAEILHVRPSLILVLGNIAMYRTIGEPKGIIRMSKEDVKWSNRYKCWLCFCVHPSLVLRNASYHELFSQSIAKFAEKMQEITK